MELKSAAVITVGWEIKDATKCLHRAEGTRGSLNSECLAESSRAKQTEIAQ